MWWKMLTWGYLITKNALIRTLPNSQWESTLTWGWLPKIDTLAQGQVWHKALCPSSYNTPQQCAPDLPADFIMHRCSVWKKNHYVLSSSSGDCFKEDPLWLKVPQGHTCKQLLPLYYIAWALGMIPRAHETIPTSPTSFSSSLLRQPAIVV